MITPTCLSTLDRVALLNGFIPLPRTGKVSVGDCKSRPVSRKGGSGVFSKP